MARGSRERGGPWRERLEENAAGTRLHLTETELQRIDQVLPQYPVAGQRYLEAAMAFLDR